MGKLTMKHGWNLRELLEFAKVGVISWLNPYQPGPTLPPGSDRIQDLARVVEAIVDHLEGQPVPVDVTMSRHGFYAPRQDSSGAWSSEEYNVSSEWMVTVKVNHEGSLDPQEVAEKVKAVLKDMGCNGAAIR